MATVYDFEVRTLSGDTRSLADYRGQVLLIVNVASQCGFTPQYAGLEALYREFRERGFSVLGFPCNQFNKQEPGDETEIRAFCDRTYGVTFPMHAKVDVNGSGAHPLFQHIKKQAPGILGSESIKWNFTKFLVDKEGKVIERYAPNTTPESLRADVEAALALR